MFEQRVNSDVLTVSTVNSQDQVTQKPLRDSVKQALKNYFAQLNGQDVSDLYELVLAEVAASVGHGDAVYPWQPDPCCPDDGYQPRYAA